jgi:hypothetical protein
MKVLYLGASKEQAKFGKSEDPRKYLKKGNVYEVIDVESHSWHSLFLIKVKKIIRKFNSVCFVEIRETNDNSTSISDNSQE